MNIKRLLLTGIAITLLTTSHRAFGQIAQRMDSLAQLHHAKGFNGNVFYSKNDSVIFSGQYGYRNMDSRQILNDATIFELASCSKQFTAVAIIQLIERKAIGYNTLVHEVLPDFSYDNITIEHLLRHQSGLPDHQKILSNKSYWNPKTTAVSEDVVQLISRLNLSLHFPPGSQYEYSNTGYVILAVIIEKVSGLSYAAYIKEHIFKPAAMHTASIVTSADDPETYKNVALGYTFNQRKKKYQPAHKDKNHQHLNWMRTVTGGAGIYASVLDIEAWKQALRTNVLITEESKELMFSTDPVSEKYGHGVAIYHTESKGKWVYHNGSWGGAKTMTLYLPESNELLVILSNNRYADTYKTFDEELYNLL